MKKLFIIICFGSAVFSSCQTISYGTYESKQGSKLIINKDNTFHYQRSSAKIDTDIIAVWYEYEAYGKFKKKGTLLYLTSDDLKLEDNIERGIEFKTNEIDREIKNTLSTSNNISVKYDSDLISVFICNTGIENYLNFDDVSNCFKLKENNSTALSFENYFLRVYPNIDNYKIRGLHNIHTMYFDSNYLKKEIENDLEIDISFDIDNFDLVFFNKEVMVIKGDKIYHEGQKFVFKEGSK